MKDKAALMDEGALRELFLSRGAIQQGHFYRLSGRHTDWYVQCARLFEEQETAGMLGRELAARLAETAPDIVLAAAIGGVLPGWEVARALNKKLFYCEKRDGALILRRGFSIKPGMRVLIVEDEVSTGQSVMEMLEIVSALGGTAVAVGCLVDKSGSSLPLDIPLVSLLTFKAEHYKAEACPMCAQGLPLMNLR